MSNHDLALANRAKSRDEFAMSLDARELKSGRLAVRDQSTLGISHDLCEHHQTASTCVQCIYGDKGNAVIIDMNAMGYAERVNHRKETGERLDPVEIAEQAFRAGAASGIAMEREVPLVKSIAAARTGNVDADAAIAALVGAANGQISRVEALQVLNRWAEREMKSLAAEADPHGKRVNALTSGRGIDELGMIE